MESPEKTLSPWQLELSQSVTQLDELYQLLDLPAIGDDSVAADYPLFVPRSFVQRMAKGDPLDPLLLQVLPRREELQSAVGFSCDPVGESASLSANGGVLKKYPGRVLLLTTPSCGIHCRFCFRRHLSKRDAPNGCGHGDFDKIGEAIARDTSIEEVILSGGDPLFLDDEMPNEAGLDHLLGVLEKIPHVKRIRIHSRLPVVLPSRITGELHKVLTWEKPVYLVLHVNHPNEIGHEFCARRKWLSGPVLLSQTVLLRGVNDDVETLARLFTALVDQGVVPYYLHQLDRVQGAAHFEVPEETGLRLMAELRNRLPGYAVPKYVREVAGAAGKRWIMENGE